MKLENIIVEDLDGHHADGWCNRLVRGRVRSTVAAKQFFAEIWIKSEPGNDRLTAASLSIETSTPTIIDVHRDSPTLIEVDFDIAQSADLSFRIYCENQMGQTGADARQLSFVLMSLGAR